MSKAYYAGLAFGLVFAFAVKAIAGYIKKRKGVEDNKYDERQLLAQGRAYKIAFFSMMGYFAAAAVLESFDVKWAMVQIVMFLGIIVGVAVYVLCAIHFDAYVGLNKNLKEFNRSSILMCVAMLCLSVTQIDYFIEDGVLGSGVMLPTVFLLWLAIILAANLREKKHRADAETDDEI